MIRRWFRKSARVRGMGWAGALILSIGLFASPLAAAHPGHASLAEIELNLETGNLEVALCVWPEVLERAINSGDQPALRLESRGEAMAEVDRRIVALLDRQFVVRDASGKALEIRWVGKQVDLKRCWIYFEVVDAADAARLILENRLFTDRYADQVNGATLIVEGRRTSWLFSRDEFRHVIRERSENGLSR